MTEKDPNQFHSSGFSSSEQCEDEIEALHEQQRLLGEQQQELYASLLNISPSKEKRWHTRNGKPKSENTDEE